MSNEANQLVLQGYQIVDQGRRANNYFREFLNRLVRAVKTLQAGTFSGGLAVVDDSVFDGKVTFADQDLTTAANFYAGANSATVPIIAFDGSDDSIRFNRTANRMNFLVGGTTYFSVRAEGPVINVSHTPASASDTGDTGTIAWDTSYIYVCTSTDTWKRAALSTW